MGVVIDEFKPFLKITLFRSKDLTKFIVESGEIEGSCFKKSSTVSDEFIADQKEMVNQLVDRATKEIIEAYEKKKAATQ